MSNVSFQVLPILWRLNFHNLTKPKNLTIFIAGVLCICSVIETHTHIYSYIIHIQTHTNTCTRIYESGMLKLICSEKRNWLITHRLIKCNIWGHIFYKMETNWSLLQKKNLIAVLLTIISITIILLYFKFWPWRVIKYSRQLKSDQSWTTL